MNKLSRFFAPALLALALFSGAAAAQTQTTVTNDTKFQLNRMDPTASKVQLGTIIQQLADPSLGFYTASITISQAQLLAINSTPVQLIAAPGAGKLILVDGVEILHTYSTAAYATCGKVQIQYHGSTDIMDLAAATITGAVTKNYTARPSTYNVDNSTGSAASDMTALANLGVDFTAASADCTLGNVANILKVRLKYRIITLQT